MEPSFLVEGRGLFYTAADGTTSSSDCGDDFPDMVIIWAKAGAGIRGLPQVFEVPSCMTRVLVQASSIPKGYKLQKAQG